MVFAIMTVCRVIRASAVRFRGSLRTVPSARHTVLTGAIPMSNASPSVSPRAAEVPLILTLDIGSSSVRAMVYDRSGRAVEGVAARERYELRTSTNGTSEDNPDEAMERIARCVDAVLQAAGPLVQHIAAVAVDTLVSTLMGVDTGGRPLTPVYSYADTRNDVAAETLRDQLDEEVVHQRTGAPLRTAYWPARLAWLKRVRPALWRDVSRWLTLGEYLELQLFGRTRVSYSVASWSGLLDRHLLEWDAPLLAVLSLSESRLSPLVERNEPLQGLIAPYAARWHLLREVPWFPAVGDGAAATIGSGVTHEGRVALTVGTTGAIRVVRNGVMKVPEGLWCYRIDRYHALLGGATSEGGNIYAWLSHTLQLPEARDAEAALAASAPDRHGLTLLPFLAGERSPDWAGNVQATIHGITMATTPMDILRASLEAVAYRFAVIAERLDFEPDTDYRYIASGSALLRSPAWMQIFADVLGKTVVASAELEATSRGTALLALHSLGEIPALESVTAADGKAYYPNPVRHEVYQAAAARQQWLYDRLIRLR